MKRKLSKIEIKETPKKIGKTEEKNEVEKKLEF
jgi:hypothetical protein